MSLRRVIPNLFERFRFRNLTTAQREAIVDIMVMATLADAGVAREELLTIAATVQTFGWDSDTDAEGFMNARLDHHADIGPDTRRDALSSHADLIVESWLREEVYLFCAGLVASDRDIDPSESDFLRDLIAAFEIGPERLQTLTSRVQTPQ